MKLHNLIAISLTLLVTSAHGQYYDSTGGARLWAPNPSTGVNTPEVIDVSGYGKYPEGAMLAVYSGKSGAVTTFYACVVKKGGGGGRPPLTSGTSCPYNTTYIVTASGVYHDGGGNDGG